MMRRMTTIAFLAAMLAVVTACGDTGGSHATGESGQSMSESGASNSEADKAGDHMSGDGGGGMSGHEGGSSSGY